MSAISVATLLGAWALASDVLHLAPSLILPSPDRVLGRATWLLTNTYQGETLLGHVAASLQVVVIAWFIAMAIGLPLGAAMGWFPTFRRFVNPVFQLIRPIPPIAWIPFAIIWFGIDPPARIVVVAMAAFSPCVINAYEAVRSVDRPIVWAARTAGAGQLRILVEIVVPAGLPVILTGARIALGNAWMTLVAAELLAAQAGLGYIMQVARQALQADIIVVSMAMIGLLGALFSAGLGLLGERLTPWERASGS
jgi:NitT/TauT family transport system permease protein/taurine transport system permease protein